MNKKMFEDFRTKQMMLECDKEMILKEMQDMEKMDAFLTNGVSEESKRLSDLYISSVKKSMEKIASEQKQVVAAINSLENMDWKILLKLRYIDGLPMPKVERKMNISHRTSYRYLNAAFVAMGVEN